MANSHTLLLLLTTICLARTANEFIKILVTDPAALCLDGSSAAYYYHKGDSSKFILSFEGGGWCGDSNGVSQTLQSCYQRSKTDLGSSSKYPSTISFSEGILSDSSDNIYKGRSLVHLKYCDGTGHQGYTKNPVDYKSQKLYFRGQLVTTGQLNSIDKLYKLFNASEIIITGQSAGGLAAMVWSNYIASKVLNTTKIYVLPDSGIFLDQQNFVTGKHDFRQSIINFMTLANLDGDPPTAQCVKANPKQKWKCMFAQYLYQYIKAPIFPIQSLYDYISFMLMGIGCVSGDSLAACSETQMKYIEQYRADTVQVMENIKNYNPRNGGWGIACSHHVFTMGTEFYSANYKAPAGSGLSIELAVLLWQGNNQQHFFIDSVSWPNNAPCSGLNMLSKE